MDESASSEDGTADGRAADALEAGRLLFARECRFIVGAARIEDLPAVELPEVAFAGRSNVGKSSLINALTGRRMLARTSNAPGRTQQLNFFALGGRLMLVDLPGYGYARAPKGEVERWTRLIRLYLRGRVNLRRLCLLIDARHGVKPNDRQVMDLLDTAAVAYQLVLTKTDKLKRGEVEDRLRGAADEIRRRAAAGPRILTTSARLGTGIAELRAELAALAAPAPLG